MAESLVLIDEVRKERFEFPVNPERISVSDGREFAEIGIVGAGYALLAGPLAIQELSWDSFFPRNYDQSFCNYFPIERPIDSVRRIERWLGRDRTRQQPPVPVRAIIAGGGFSQLMVVTAFSWEYRGGEPGDIYYSITLRHFRRQTIRVESAPAPVKKDKGRDTPTPPTGQRTYTVKAGDTLWLIASRMYGDGSKWSRIYDANKNLIGPNPNLIHPGQTLVIP